MLDAGEVSEAAVDEQLQRLNCVSFQSFSFRHLRLIGFGILQ